MVLRVRPATADDIRVFVGWRYDPPYDVYDITEPVERAVAYFLRADVRCHVLVEDDALVGFATFGRDARVAGGAYEHDALDIGLGIDPGLTGRGRGREFVRAIVEHACVAFGRRTLRVTIAEHNPRAVRVWSATGFEQVERFATGSETLGGRHFVVLIAADACDAVPGA